MTDTNDLKEILDAMEEINLINDIRKKKRIEKNTRNNQEKIFKYDNLSENEKIPQSTEEIIKQAEKQLTFKRKK